MLLLDINILFFAYSDSSLRRIFTPERCAHHTLELVAKNSSFTAVIVFNLMLVFVQAGPIAADCPSCSIIAVNRRVLADVESNVLFFINIVLVLDLIYVAFPPRHIK